MKYRHLGRTGLQVSAWCFGGNVLGWTVKPPEAAAVLDAFVEGGGNFIDTSNSYSRWVAGHVGGESETVLGAWMRERGNRGQMVVASKCGSPIGIGPNDRGLSRKQIMAAVEGSLRRLQTEYIDLYQAHFEDPTTPPEETLRAFDDLVCQGKVLYLGASNYRATTLLRSLWTSERLGLARYDSLQPRYSLVSRAEFEGELQQLCLEEGIGVITHSSLAGGFLTGKYQAGQALPASPRAAQVQERYLNAGGLEVLDRLQAVAAARGATPAQVALAWIMARPGITAPIASATSVAQVRELLGAIDLDLGPEELQTLSGS